MHVEYCLDLRELIGLDGLAQSQDAAIEAFLEMPMLGNCRRMYVGSSFCPQALLASRPLTEAALDVCRSRGMQVTLSVPIATQSRLEQQLKEVAALLELGAGVIDEVAANDFGMLGWLCERLLGVGAKDSADACRPINGAAFGVIIGRLLSKDARDPRDPDYPWQPYVPALLQKGADGGSLLDRMLATWSYWDDEREEYQCPIAGLELDPTHESLLLHDMPSRFLAALNGPACYMSTGQICEYASLGLADDQLFRPNSACARQCADSAICYRGTSGVEFAKLGRTVYFQPDWQCVPQGVKSYRQLVSPLWEARCR